MHVNPTVNCSISCQQTGADPVECYFTICLFSVLPFSFFPILYRIYLNWLGSDSCILQCGFSFSWHLTIWYFFSWSFFTWFFLSSFSCVIFSFEIVREYVLQNFVRIIALIANTITLFSQILWRRGFIYHYKVSVLRKRNSIKIMKCPYC